MVSSGREKQARVGRKRIRVLVSREATGATEDTAWRSFAARQKAPDEQ